MNGEVYDDYDELMTLPYRQHCEDWNSTNFLSVNGHSGSLKLLSVKFFEIRAQY